jgi:hypothetical protein
MFNDDELEDVMEDNFPDYFYPVDYSDDNDMYVLQILDKSGEVDDVVMGLDKIKQYIDKLK